MSDEPFTITIRDLGVAVALVTCGFEIQNTKQDASGRTYFVFQEDAALDEAAVDYYADTLLVNARSFFDNTKTLNGRIYDGN